MTLQLPGGTISISDIKNEFGGNGNLSDYYRGGSVVPAGSQKAGVGIIPSSGLISLSDFFGTSQVHPNTVNYFVNGSGGTAFSGGTWFNFIVPMYNSLVIQVWGAGGGGGSNAFGNGSPGNDSAVVLNGSFGNNAIIRGHAGGAGTSAQGGYGAGGTNTYDLNYITPSNGYTDAVGNPGTYTAGGAAGNGGGGGPMQENGSNGTNPSQMTGSVPGGGGGGARWSENYTGSSGGGGAYVGANYANNLLVTDIAVGSILTCYVGAGGVGGGAGTWDAAGNGGNGQITISWT